jgi:hypothetical protein
MSLSLAKILALVAFIVFMHTWVLLPDDLFSDFVLTQMVREDGLIETLGAFSLLVASGLFFAGFLQARHRSSTRVMRLFLLGLAVALFFGAGEELSWGQRLLGIDTPGALQERNYQQELNVHNLDRAGWWGVWRGFEAFTLLFAVALPLAAWKSSRASALLSRYVPIVPLALCGLFLLNELMAVLAGAAFGSWDASTLALRVGESNDVFDAGGIGEGNGLTETVFSLLYAVVAFDLVHSSWRSEPQPDALLRMVRSRRQIATVVLLVGVVAALIAVLGIPPGIGENPGLAGRQAWLLAFLIIAGGVTALRSPSSGGAPSGQEKPTARRGRAHETGGLLD